MASNLTLDLKIIKAVKSRQVLYNKKLEQCCDPKQVKKAWKAVAAECGRIGEEDFMKSRWQSIRKKFVRSRKIILEASNDPSVKKRIDYEWPLYNMLDFLNLHIKTRNKKTPRKRAPESLNEMKVSNTETIVAHDEQIIKAVEASAAIYNPKLEEHGDPVFIENAWRQIASDCGLSVEFVKNRWNILKLKFVKEKRKLLLASRRTGTENTVESDWYLYSMMLFMDDHLQLSNTTNASNCVSEDESPEGIKDGSYDLAIGNMHTIFSPQDECNFGDSDVSHTGFQLDQSNHGSITSTSSSLFINADNSLREVRKASKDRATPKGCLEDLLRENLEKSGEILENVEKLKSQSKVDKYMAAFTEDIKAMPEAKQVEVIRKIAAVIFDWQ